MVRNVVKKKKKKSSKAKDLVPILLAHSDSHQNEKTYTIYIIALEQTVHFISNRPLSLSAGAE